MHSSDTCCAFLHSPLLQIEIQKRQLLKKFLSPPYRTKQGVKTKHLLKNLHFLQKVGAGFLLRAAIFLTPLSHKMGVKTEMLFEKFSKYFWKNKKPGTKGYHITSRWSASYVVSFCARLFGGFTLHRWEAMYPGARWRQNPSYEGSWVHSVVLAL